MRTLYLVVVIFIGFGLTGCTPVPPPPPDRTCYDAGYKHKKPKRQRDPMAVSFYSKGAVPKQPFVVIGEESISKFNEGGVKRQEATIQDTMRQLAASMGGDAVIDISRDEKAISGKVITYDDGIG